MKCVPRSEGFLILEVSDAALGAGAEHGPAADHIALVVHETLAQFRGWLPSGNHRRTWERYKPMITTVKLVKVCELEC